MKSKFDKLKHLKSPYSVKFSEDIESAINLSREKLIQIPELKGYIEKYVFDKKDIPLWVIEYVCKINLDDDSIPAQYQYLWYCLHNATLTRKQPSGRIFNTKVNFTTVYLSIDDEIKKYLIKVSEITNISLSNLPILWGNKPSNYLSQGKLPLIAMLKISEILKLNIWDLLEGHILNGKTSLMGKITIPKNNIDIEILFLIIWINTEGHIDLGSTHIEINQKNDMQSLIKLKELFINKFGINPSSLIFAKGVRGEDRLLISSSPLKQLLTLKYDLVPGYKTGSMSRINIDNIDEEGLKKLMVAFIQTEGCFTYSYTRNKKRKLPKFEFIVKDKNLCLDCLTTLQKLGFNPYYYERNDYHKVGIFDHKEAIRLINKTKTYLYNDKKIVYLKKVCSNGIGL